MMCFLRLLLLSFLPVGLWAAEKGIYGEDDRLEYYQVADPAIQKLFRSTAVQIRRDHFLATEQGIVINYQQTAQSENSLCSDVPFASQYNPGECSGFLVAPDILVTAGHCVRDEDECRQYRWVFDFYYQRADSDVLQIPNDSIYSCAEILAQEFQSGKREDYAIIRLSKKVTDRDPLHFRQSDEIGDNQTVFAIGYPLGVPAKLAPHALVQKNGSRFYFTTNLDTFVVNSGSAVFNAQTHEVEGILVRGAEDLIFDSNNQCNRYRIHPFDQGQEDVMRITRLPLGDWIPF